MTIHIPSSLYRKKYMKDLTRNKKKPSAKPFDVFLVNFTYVCGSYQTLDEAIKKGYETGYDFQVYENFPNKAVTEILASWR